MTQQSLSEQAVAILRAAMNQHSPPLTATTLAERIGVSREAVSRVLSGRFNLQMETFERYLTAAGGQAWLTTVNGDYTEKDLDPYAFERKLERKIGKMSKQ